MGIYSQRARWFSVLISALLGAWLYALSPIGAGRFLDDHAQLAMLEGRYPAGRSALDLFSFCRSTQDRRALIEAGVLPWWTSQRYSLAMLRPLPSALSALDHALFARGTLGPRLHSLAWFVALLALASRLLFALLPARAAALSTVLFSLSGTAVIPVGWLAGRNAMMASALSFWAIAAALDYLRDASARHAREALLALALAALSGEYSLALLGPLCLMALSRPGPIKPRITVILLGSLLVALPSVVSRALHYGARDSTGYLDPIGAPGAWLGAAPARASELVSWLLGARPMAVHSAALLTTLLALHLATFALAFAAIEARRRSLLAAFAIGSLIALAPMLSAPPSSRLLLVPSLAISAMVGLAVHGSLSETLSAPWRWVLRALLVPVVILHALLGPHAARDEALGMRALFEASRVAHQELERAAFDDTPSTLILVHTQSLDILHHAPFGLRRNGLSTPLRWRVLSYGAAPVLALRTAENALEISSLGAVLVSPAGELYRPRVGAFWPGERVVVPPMTITVLEVTGGLPTRLRAVFERSLDDPQLAWISSVGGHFVRARIPALHGAALCE